MWTSACSKHHCVLPPLMLLFWSSRSHPFLLQNTTSCFKLTFWADGHHGEISSKCFLFTAFFFSPQGIHTLSSFHVSQHPYSTVNVCPQSSPPHFFPPLPQYPFIHHFVYLILSFILVKNVQKISLSLSTLWGNPSVFLTLSPLLFHSKSTEISTCA